MKIKATYDKLENSISFDNFKVVKKNDNFFGVYLYNELITHGTTLENASKKAKLLQIGFDLGRDFGC